MMRGKSSLWVAIALVAVLVTSCKKSLPPRAHHEQLGYFSYEPPLGWTEKSVPGFEFKYMIGPEINGYAPNINVVKERFRGTPRTYLQFGKKSLQSVFGEKIKFISESEFTTEDGIKGVKLTSLLTHQNNQEFREQVERAKVPKEFNEYVKSNNFAPQKVLQSAYILGNGRDMYTITCSWGEKEGDLGPTFDGVVRSFRLH